MRIPINRELDIEGAGGGKLVDEITNDYIKNNNKRRKELAKSEELQKGEYYWVKCDGEWEIVRT